MHHVGQAGPARQPHLCHASMLCTLHFILSHASRLELGISFCSDYFNQKTHGSAHTRKLSHLQSGIMPHLLSPRDTWILICIPPQDFKLVVLGNNGAMPAQACSNQAEVRPTKKGPARVFLNRSQTSKNNKKTQKIRPDIQNTGQDIQSWFFEAYLKTFSWKSEMKNGVQGQTYLDR